MDQDDLKMTIEIERRKKPSIGQLEHMFELIRKGALTSVKLQRFMESLGQFEASRMTFLMTSRAGCELPSYAELQAKFYAVHPDYERARFSVTGPNGTPGHIRARYAFIERDVYPAEEAIEEMKKHGFRPALYEELLDFDSFVRDRETLERFEARRFIALGSYWKDEDGTRRFPVLQKTPCAYSWCLTLAKLSYGDGPLPEDMAFLMVEI